MSKTQKILVLLFILGCASVIATQVIAHKFDYHQALGSPLFGKIYYPWDGIVWTIKYYDIYQSTITWGIAAFICVTGFSMLLLIIKMQLTQRSSKSIDDLHGSAHWAVESEIKEAGLLKNQGAYVGAWIDKKGTTKYLRHDGPEHIIALAPTRSGKGVGLVLPTLLSWVKSVIVYDIKGENWALTAGWRKQHANNITLKFDPSNNDGSSCAYNPLDAVRLDSEKNVGDVQNIATIIVDPNGKGLESHWDKTAFALLTGVILHTMFKIRKEEKRSANLNDVAVMLANPDKPVVDVLEEMLKYEHTEQGVHPVIAGEARAMLNKAEEELSSVVSTAIANLSLYRDPIVARNTAYSDFSIADLMNYDKPVSLYIVDRPSDSDRIRPLIRLMITQFIRCLTEKMEFKDGRSVAGYKHRLLLLLDEFPALKKLTMIEDGLAFMAGYGIKAYLICQDIQQLTGIYSRDEKIIANSHIRVGYAPNKLETAETLSKMSGTTTITKEDINISGSRFGGFAKQYSKSLREVQRPLITADEVMRLKKPKTGDDGKIVSSGELLIFAAGYAPIKGTQILYFNDTTFSARAAIEAPKKSDKVKVTPKSKGCENRKFKL